MSETREVEQAAATPEAVPEHTSDGEPAVDGDVDESREDVDETDEEDSVALLVREGDVAGDYLERLLDIVDYDGDIDLDVENGRAVVAVVGGAELKPLIGPHGATLEALQELTRLAVQRETGVRSRLMLDIGGYRARRRDELGALARRTADEVVADKAARRLVPMNAFERKVIHDTIASLSGVASESEGEEPERRVVVSPTP